MWLWVLAGVVLGGLLGGGVGGSLGGVAGAVIGWLVGVPVGAYLSLREIRQTGQQENEQLRALIERQGRDIDALNTRVRALETDPPSEAATASALAAVPVAVTSVPLPSPAETESTALAPAETGLTEAALAELALAGTKLTEAALAELALAQSRLAEAEHAELAHAEAEAAEAAATLAQADPGAREPESAESQSRADPPRPPSLISRGLAAFRNWLLGGNTVLRVGVLVLFFGLAFLLRYATERFVIPVEVRYAFVAICAVVLLALGWRLRKRNPNYALVLQGTGVAVLYLTVFAAMRLHPLIEPLMAFALLVVMTVFSAVLAVAQNALGLALAAALGGFAAPLLTSTGSGNYVALFSYFILLNAGILAIAWFKAWRPLNLLGFLATFGIAGAWGASAYRPELLWSVEPFLLAFFLMYVGIGLLFARRSLHEAADEPAHETAGREGVLRWSRGHTDYIDGTIMFGPPLIGFGFQYVIVQHLEFAPAFSALALGLFYMALASVLRGSRVLLLREVCLALGVAFGTLAIPLGLDARWTSAAWAVEGAGIYWLGLRQGRPLARVFALLLQAGAALAFLGEVGWTYDVRQVLRPVGAWLTQEATVLYGPPLGALMLGAAMLFSFLQLRLAPPAAGRAWEQRWMRPVLAVAGLAFVYLIAPLTLGANGTAIAWAVAGLATLYAGLRLQARSFLFTAITVQLLGGALFAAGMQPDWQGITGGVFYSGWRGLLMCALIGAALVFSIVIAGRDKLVSEDRALLRGLSATLLAGLLLMNVAVLFVLPWRSAAGVWALSGLLIIWLSLLLQWRVSFVFGLALQLAGGLAFLTDSPLPRLPSEGLRPLAHAGFWAPLTLALAAQLGAWRVRHVRLRELGGKLDGLKLQILAQLLLAWGAAWWALAWGSEALRFLVDGGYSGPALLAMAALTALLWGWLAARLRWRSLALLSAMLTPAAALIGLYQAGYAAHPAQAFGWLGWLLVFAVHAWLLRRLAGLLPAFALRGAHLLGCWLALLVLTAQLRWGLTLLAGSDNAWRWLGWAVLPIAYLVGMASKRAWPWPVAAYAREYRVLAAAPVALLLLLWLWLANIFSDGDAAPLPYLPLINPLELGMLAALLAAHAWQRGALPQLGLGAYGARIAQGLGGASLFAVLTAAVFRAVHHWGGIAYDLQALLASMLTQAGLSIVWTLIALPLMILGHLRGLRGWWLLGAALIGVVVAKLFFVELSNTGGLERVVSFIGVGALLLVVGYFAPLPPRKKGAAPIGG